MNSGPLYLTRLIALVGDERTDELVLPWASTLSTAFHLPLTLVQVVDPGSAESIPASEAVAEDTLAILASDTRLARVAVDTRVEVGLVEVVVSNIAREEPGSLLILASSREERGEQEVTEWPLFPLLDAMTTPYVLIPSRSVAPTQIHRLVVGNDRSDLAEAVLRTAQTIGHSLNVDVIEVEGVEPEGIEVEDFTGMSPVVSPRLVRARGLASRVILRTARARDAELIVVGSHGLGRGPGLLAGRTTGWLLANSDRPIVVVPEAGR